MIRTDENALICDLAETYQIYDYKQLPPTRVAVFSYGLKSDSRIKMKMSGQVVPLETLLMARISDGLNTLIWFQTKDGQKGKNRPSSMVEMITNKNKEPDKDVVTFSSGEDFVNLRNKLIGGE